jgi:hypothetical protein
VAAQGLEQRCCRHAKGDRLQVVMTLALGIGVQVQQIEQRIGKVAGDLPPVPVTAPTRVPG